MLSAFGNVQNPCYLGQASVLNNKATQQTFQDGLCWTLFALVQWTWLFRSTCSCGLCRELGHLAQPPHPLPACSRSDPGIHCPPPGACGEAGIFTGSLSLLPPGPDPRTGWYSFGNTAWFCASLLQVTGERQKYKWAIRANPLSSQNASLCITRASGTFVHAHCMSQFDGNAQLPFSTHKICISQVPPSSPLRILIMTSRKQDFDPWSPCTKPCPPSLLQSPWLLLCVTW